MVLRAAEPGVLGTLMVGDKIRFMFEQRQGQMTVTRVVPVL